MSKEDGLLTVLSTSHAASRACSDATPCARVEERAERRGGHAGCTLDVVARRSVADANQRARWTSEEALAAAEKKGIVRTAARARTNA